MISVDRGPFEMVPHWLLHSSASSYAIRLYLLLRKHGDKDGVSFPGRRRLAEPMKASVSTLTGQRLNWFLRALFARIRE